MTAIEAIADQAAQVELARLRLKAEADKLARLIADAKRRTRIEGDA